MGKESKARRIKNRVSVYYRVLDKAEINRIKDEIYHTIEPDDSFSFFMSLKKMDSSFGDLNKAFVLMMKQMDAKLNYIIELLREGGKIKELEGFSLAHTCDLCQSGMSIETTETIEPNSFIYLKLFLPIAPYHAIKILAKAREVEKRDTYYCVDVEILDISAENRELIIHYMIYVERKMAKDRIDRNVT